MAIDNNGPFDGAGSILSTVGGPSDPTPPESLGATTPESERLLEKVVEDAELAARMPYNEVKPLEYGPAAFTPHRGETRTPDTPLATASTTTEDIASRKLGDGAPEIGANPLNGPLDRVRVDDSGRELTTNQGVKVADNQDSLKIGLRGPTAMEDFIFREKITHFDHERIPERVVHARGAGAHGFFESYQDLSSITRASLFAKPGKRTPVFVRFSTVVGSRGSSDTGAGAAAARERHAGARLPAVAFAVAAGTAGIRRHPHAARGDRRRQRRRCGGGAPDLRVAAEGWRPAARRGPASR
jgi:catalase